MTTNPYVVSQDIGILLGRWARNGGFSLPPKEDLHLIREKFSGFMVKIFQGFEYVTEDELVSGMLRLVASFGLPAISLDRVYFLTENHLDVSRANDATGKDLGWVNRSGYESIPMQLQKIRATGITEATIVDDVIFSGEVILKVSELLATAGIRAKTVCAGVGVSEGVLKLREAGFSVTCVREYGEVVDEVCERDFYPGVPMSGRQLVGVYNVGIPYIYPFGRPGKWASIPDSEEERFSKFCLTLTIELFELIEKYSGREVRVEDLSRGIYKLPVNSGNFVLALKKLL